MLSPFDKIQKYLSKRTNGKSVIDTIDFGEQDLQTLQRPITQVPVTKKKVSVVEGINMKGPYVVPRVDGVWEVCLGPSTLGESSPRLRDSPFGSGEGVDMGPGRVHNSGIGCQEGGTRIDPCRKI